MLSGHGRLDDHLLHGATVWAVPARDERRQSRTSGAEFLAGVVSFSAPGAGGIGQAVSRKRRTSWPAVGNW